MAGLVQTLSEETGPLSSSLPLIVGRDSFRQPELAYSMGGA